MQYYRNAHLNSYNKNVITIFEFVSLFSHKSDIIYIIGGIIMGYKKRKTNIFLIYY